MDLLSKLKGRRIAVIGDAVADQFLSGTITRVSREAPVFITRHDVTETRPGGAANAAANIASLGGLSSLTAVIGDDRNGELLLHELESCGVETAGVIVDPAITTTTKLRVLAGQQYAPRQQVIRIDYENSAPMSEASRNALIEKALESTEGADAVVMSDYDYGVAFTELYNNVREKCLDRQIPLLIDSRFNLRNFTGATSATPNQEEVERMLGGPMDDENCEGLREELGLKALLVTCGNKGMKLYEEAGALSELDAVGGDVAVDVTGAGDTVIAAYALGLASGLSFADSAFVANHAGGIVVMKKGTAVVSIDELAAMIGSSASNMAAT